jgi:hypothetical protein
MNIILGQELLKDIDSRYLVLELDTFESDASPEPVTAYALIDELSLQDMLRIGEFVDLHRNLIKNYRLRNWKYCEDAIEHLMPQWNGGLVSFYQTLLHRVGQLKDQVLPEDWTGNLKK